MPILNYSTNVSPEKTIAEIQRRLVANGAKQLSFDYNDDQQLASLTFRIDIDGRPIWFSITPNFAGVLAAMQSAREIPRSKCTPAQAVRVAWRIEKDWLEAQLAKIEAGLATPLQLLLPYAVTSSGATFYQQVAEQPKKILGSLSGGT